MDEVNSDLEYDIDNLMNNSDTESVLKESLENELDSWWWVIKFTCARS